MQFSLEGEKKSLQTLMNKLEWFQGKQKLLASSVLVRVLQKNRANRRERARGEYKNLLMWLWRHASFKVCCMQGENQEGG